MDGVSTMDTGSSGAALFNMNTESIAEVKVLESGYQAEYGLRERPAGAWRSPRAGRTGSAARSTTCAAIPTGTPTARRTTSTACPRPSRRQQDIGFSIGGPIGKPGGNNKLFFFYRRGVQPRDRRRRRSRRSGCRPRWSAQGDFSQTRDNLGNPYPVHQGSAVDRRRARLRRAIRRLLPGRWRARQDPGQPALSAWA